jgi:hypothetical protein
MFHNRHKVQRGGFVTVTLCTGRVTLLDVHSARGLFAALRCSGTPALWRYGFSSSRSTARDARFPSWRPTAGHPSCGPRCWPL